ncbi:GNAT family N-acetyltransferase [Halobium salinum]|uniref:GNAT family N-acetyltransferase n=1 Tax=Halobium salinum TaxID=1364940 RepID=A0ABD5P9F9_9EURY|nr:GNAT family N-acetyltransferase [Halobium salinum]
MTEDTWSDRDGSDYIPRIYHDWIAGDGDDQRTFLLDVEGEDAVAGVLQAVLLSEHESWMQGMRVNSRYRGMGLSTRLQRQAFEWARERGSTVARNMVFSWNVAGLGGSRAAGFDPCTEFRWAHPDPDADAGSETGAGTSTVEVAAEGDADPDAAWSFWNAGAARDHLRGLVLDAEESWAVSELTRERLRAVADDGRLFVARDDGTRGFTYRNRTYDRPNEDGEVVTWAEYAVGAWDTPAACEALLRAVSRDAAGVDADRTRVYVPERVRWVSDVAAARVRVSDEPDFVMAADLTRDSLVEN